MDYFIGEIGLFGFNFAPMSWAMCQGQVMQIQQNSALYSLLGTQFGGNGTTNFNLPDLRGRVPVGQGAAPPPISETYTVGQIFGNKTKTLIQNELAPHTHAISEIAAGNTVGAPTVAVNASSASATKLVPTSNYWAVGWGGTQNEKNFIDTKNVTMASDAVTVTKPPFYPSNLTTSSVGGAAAFPLAQPSLVLNYCICISGIYPTRD